MNPVNICLMNMTTIYIVIFHFTKCCREDTSTKSLNLPYSSLAYINMILLFQLPSNNLTILMYSLQHDFTIPGNSCLYRYCKQLGLIPEMSQRYSYESRINFQQIGLRSIPQSQKTLLCCVHQSKVYYNMNFT